MLGAADGVSQTIEMVGSRDDESTMKQSESRA